MILYLKIVRPNKSVTAVLICELKNKSSMLGRVEHMIFVFHVNAVNKFICILSKPLLSMLTKWLLSFYTEAIKSLNKEYILWTSASKRDWNWDEYFKFCLQKLTVVAHQTPF